ncbi:MAG: AI-2E family transporter [Deltaproteobacteria bacterium]|nr:AI-2E family transporter [Deltaproteobacteria bacterium]
MDQSSNKLPEEHRQQSPPGAASAPDQSGAGETPGRGQDEKLNRYGLVVLLVAAGLAVVPLFRFFLVPVILAATFCTLFYPLYARLLDFFRGHSGLAALLTCFILLGGLLIPAYVVLHLVALQMIDLVAVANRTIRDILAEGDRGLLGELARLPLIRFLVANELIRQLDWTSLVQEAAKTAGKIGTFLINKTSGGIINLLATLGVTVFSMFYFFKDGRQILGSLEALSPLRQGHDRLLFDRFVLISRATIKGTLLIGVIQGLVGSLVLLVFGIDTWLLWGFVTLICSVIPMVGPWVVLIPAGVVQIALGHLWQGVAIILISLTVVSSIDNLLRPRLVGREARIHDLLIFFATLGGIATFGVMGFIVGPALLSLFLAVVDIYKMEFKEQPA